MPVRTKRMTREELPVNDNLCFHCEAKCCRYFALPLETPSEWSDFDQMRWFLLHENAAIFTEGKDWYLLVFSNCKNLDADNRCTGYDARPQICRDYTNRKCEYDDHWVYDRYFELAEQIEEYAEAVLPHSTGDSLRSNSTTPWFAQRMITS